MKKIPLFIAMGAIAVPVIVYCFGDWLPSIVSSGILLFVLCLVALAIILAIVVDVLKNYTGGDA